MHKREYFKRVTTVTLSALICIALIGMPAFSAGAEGYRENAITFLPNAQEGVSGEYIGQAPDSKENSSVRATFEKLNGLNVLAWLMADSIKASLGNEKWNRDIEIDAMGNASVGSFNDLKKALDNHAVRVIKLTDDITMRETLTINRSISIISDDKASLKLMPGMRGRHFQLAGTGMEIHMENIAFIGAATDAGGGIAADNELKNCSLHLTACNFIGNISAGATEDKGKGGAIAIDNAHAVNSGAFEVVIDGCKFECNKAGRKEDGVGSGGAIYINTAGCNLVIKESIFTHNQSGKRGGAISYYSQAGQFVEISNTAFENNASTEGGAICLVSASEDGSALTAKLVDNKITKNIAYNGSVNTDQRMGNGGAIYATNATAASSIDLLVESGTIEDNQSYNYGGGIFLNADSEGKINATLTGGLLLDGNSADIMDGKGGGIAAIGLGTESVAISIQNAILTNNNAQFGGGIFINGSEGHNAKLDIGDDCEIAYNKANYGGGIILYENALLTAAGDWSIRENTARFSGGGLFVQKDSFANINGGFISANRAESGEGSGNRTGGGIHVCESSSIELNRCSMEGNMSENGGAIYALGQVSAENCAINENSAIYGGGVYVNAKGALSANGSSFSGNNAYVLFVDANPTGGEGGAIYTADESYANVTTTGAYFVDNNAEGGGFVLEPEEPLGYLGNSSYTTPFTNAYNNFDVNNTNGDMATLYSITVEYHYGEEDDKPLLERINRVFEGSNIQSELVNRWGADWINLHVKEGYSTGYTRFDFDRKATATEDVLIKVVYTGVDVPAATVETEEGQKPKTPQPSTNMETPSVTKEQKPLPTTSRIVLNEGKAGINNSNELAMAVPAPLPVGMENSYWGLFNAAITLVSLLTGLALLLRMAAPGKRNRAKNVLCLPHKTLGVLLSVASVLMFALTQNTSLPANPFDKWTPVLFLMLLSQLLLATAIYYKGLKARAKKKRGRRAQVKTERRKLTDAV